jgi:CBS domain-containing protein
MVTRPHPVELAVTSALLHERDVERQTVELARSLMRGHRIRHLPVLQAGKLVGILSDRDVFWIETLKQAEGDRLPVGEVMSPVPYSVAPDAPLADVAREMAERKCSSAVIMQGDTVTGVFTTTDALSALAAVLAGQSVL